MCVFPMFGIEATPMKPVGNQSSIPTVGNISKMDYFKPSVGIREKNKNSFLIPGQKAKTNS